MLTELPNNISHNLLKPLLLFFYAGFLIPILRVSVDFPKVVYQALTIYLLVAIGWHGGEELASLKADELPRAMGFMVVRFFTNSVIGILAYVGLRFFTKLRKVDAATVAGNYGSDSAETFVTCLGVLTASNMAFAPYMPVMLAVMEIPGCLVALVIVARLRKQGMDVNGNMPGEVGYQRGAANLEEARLVTSTGDEEQEVEASIGSVMSGGQGGRNRQRHGHSNSRDNHNSYTESDDFKPAREYQEGVEFESEMALETTSDFEIPVHAPKGLLNFELLHEVFLNPGICLLFVGIIIGFLSRLQGEKVTAADDALFNNLFQGFLCFFLLEMGMTASKRLKDLKSAGWQFVLFGLLAPNIFASIGIAAAHCYGMFLGTPFDVGTYVLFAVLCGAASYIAVPAVQRMAIPEASPTLPLAASPGLTFAYNVTVGIPVYMMIAKTLITKFPI